MKTLNALIKRELAVVLRSRSEFVYPLAFFVIVTVLFPLSVIPSPNQLAFVAPGVLWVAALLSILLSLNHFYQADFVDGSLEQILLSDVSAYSVCLAKVLANWLVSGLPLVVICPVIGVLFGLDQTTNLVAMLVLLIGTPTLCFIGAIGMSLIVGLRNGGVLLTLLVLPLYIPVLIFGSSAVAKAAISQPYMGEVALLLALLVLASWLAPLAASAAMKISLEQ
jgi:heme exporter protein B